MATTLATYSTSKLPPAPENRNSLVIVVDGADGKVCLALSDGKAWNRLTVGTPVSSKPVPVPTPTPAPVTGSIDFSRDRK